MLLGLAEGGYGDQAFAAGSLVVWAIVLLGLAAGILPRGEPPAPALAAGACLVGLVLLTALSLAWAADDGTAFADAIRMSLYLGLFVLVVTATARGESAPWLRGLTIGLAGIAAAALLSRFQPGLLGDADLEIARALPAAAGRLSYPIGYWNGLGAAMAICIVLLIWVGARGATPLIRALATAALPVPVLALYASTSRGGAVAAAVAVVVLIALGPARTRLLGTAAVGGVAALALVGLAAARPQLLDDPGSALAASQGDEMTLITPLVLIVTGLLRRLFDRPLAAWRPPQPLVRRSLIGVGLVALVLVVAADPIEQWNAFKRPPAEEENFGATADPSRITSSGRYQFWGAAVDAFASEPIRGIGSGAYEPFWAQNASLDAPARNAHSLLFETLAELGIGGALLVVGFFAVAALSGWRRLRLLGGPPSGEVGAALAVLGSGAVSVAIDWNYDLPLVFGTAIVAAALLTGPATLPRLAPRVEAPAVLARTRGRLAAGTAILLLAWVGICASGLHLLTERSVAASREALADDRPADAIESARDAADLEPWAAEPRVRLALAYEGIGNLPAAQEAIGAAIERDPEDWRNWVIALRLDLAANDFAGATIAYRQARDLNPRDPRFRGAADEFFEFFGAASGG